ncbi:anthranilate phosphoribosyltransferase [Halomicronema hongdechloris]
MTMMTTSLQSMPQPAISLQTWQEILHRLLEHRSLSVEQAASLMQGWLQETISPALSGAILTAIQAKGVSASELVGMVQVLQERAVQSHPRVDTHPVVDTCGTGGDGASTFNISTAVAFVVAAAGVKVAKHGNRSVSSKAGSADVLEALRIDLGASHQRVEAALDEVGITFLFAPGWHPAFKAVAPIRKTLGIRTIFNVLGPLLNPLGPTGQVIGVSDPALVEPVAEAIARSSDRHGVVVYGREHLDEAGLADLSDVAIVNDNQIDVTTVNPDHLGLAAAPTAALRGGDIRTNADILKAVLQGRGTQAQQDVVALNAAMALYVGEAIAGVTVHEAFEKGIQVAYSILRSGAAWQKLEQLAQFLA